MVGELASAARCAAIVFRHGISARKVGLEKARQAILRDLETERIRTGGSPRWELAIQTDYGLRPMPAARDIVVLDERGDAPRWTPLTASAAEGGRSLVYRAPVGQIVRDAKLGSTGRVVAVQRAVHGV